ncbi:MAG TPA: chlorophyll a/b-binding protein [Oculatellaceae cyanobacterium]
MPEQIVAILPIISYINLRKTLQNVTNGAKVMQGENRNDPTKFGFTPQAENWNGRLAMIGFIAALITEYVSGQGVLHFWGLL